MHVKDYSATKDQPVLGEGDIQWKEVFAALESSPGMEWYISEEEGSTCAGTECIKKSIDRMHAMGK